MRSSSRSETFPATEIKAIDALFERAGLRRNLRGTAAGVTGRMRFERAAQQELISATPIPRLAANGVQWMAVPGWEKMNWLWHGFSTRRGGLSRAYCAEDAPGELNLGFTDEDGREAVAQNRLLLAEAVSGDANTPLVDVKQIHSNLVLLASASDASRKMPRKADGLMTDEPGLLVGVRTADCIPILVADRKRHAVAAFHAGWRGTVNRIVESGIGRMRLQFGSRPEDLTAAIGPGIGPCCYSVGEEVLSSFESQFAYAR
jgi:YfiH family protein